MATLLLRNVVTKSPQDHFTAQTQQDIRIDSDVT